MTKDRCSIVCPHFGLPLELSVSTSGARAHTTHWAAFLFCHLFLLMNTPRAVLQSPQTTPSSLSSLLSGRIQVLTVSVLMMTTPLFAETAPKDADKKTPLPADVPGQVLAQTFE